MPETKLRNLSKNLNDVLRNQKRRRFTQSQKKPWQRFKKLPLFPLQLLGQVLFSLEPVTQRRTIGS